MKKTPIKNKDKEEHLLSRRVLPILFIIEVSTILWAQTNLRITIIGDSTVCNYAASKYPQTGWGQVLGRFFMTGSVTINNKAIGGRSSRSFYQEGRWAEIVSNLQKGEYVFIQFGHNDRDFSKEERYTDTTAYKEYLRLYVKESREKGAIPVLITPMNMNAWNGSNLREVFCEGANNYRGAMINVSKELNVPLIDLEKKSAAQQRRLGQAYCAKYIYLGLDAGEYVNFPDGISDGTHFQEMGASIMAKFVCEGITELESHTDMQKLAALLKPQYLVHIKSNKTNTGKITESENTFPQGALVTIKVKPDSDEKFQGWFDSTGKNLSAASIYAFNMPSSNVTFTARFQNGTQMYTLNTSVIGNGSISPGAGLFDEGSNITITANPAEGWEFDHWSGDETGSANPVRTSMSQDKFISANFIQSTNVLYNLYSKTIPSGSLTKLDLFSPDGRCIPSNRLHKSNSYINPIKLTINNLNNGNYIIRKSVNGNRTIFKVNICK